jgi:hypothetical protein
VAICGVDLTEIGLLKKDGMDGIMDDIVGGIMDCDVDCDDPWFL